MHCLFCKWAEKKKPEYLEIEEKRLLNQKTFNQDSYLAVLDKYPKVVGHTLIISKTHYDDITKIKNGETSIGIFQGVIEWARHIKEKLEPEKVYVLSMCDHWTDQELRARCNVYYYEHLHFHLVPRYDFDVDIRGEEVLLRNGKKIPADVTKKIYDLLKDC